MGLIVRLSLNLKLSTLEEGSLWREITHKWSLSRFSGKDRTSSLSGGPTSKPTLWLLSGMTIIPSTGSLASRSLAPISQLTTSESQWSVRSIRIPSLRSSLSTWKSIQMCLRIFRVGSSPTSRSMRLSITSCGATYRRMAARWVQTLHLMSAMGYRSSLPWATWLGWKAPTYLERRGISMRISLNLSPWLMFTINSVPLA